MLVNERLQINITVNGWPHSSLNIVCCVLQRTTYSVQCAAIKNPIKLTLFLF